MVKRPIRAFLSFSIGLLVVCLITLTFSVSASPPSSPPQIDLAQSEFNREKAALARAHLQTNRDQYNLSAEEINQLEVTDLYTSQHSGVTHVYFRQTFNGLPVLNGLLNVNLQPNGQTLIVFDRSAGSQTQWEQRSSSRSLQLSDLIEADEAVASAIEALDIPQVGIPRTIQSTNDLSARSLVVAEGSSPEPIPAERAYFAIEGELRPIWEVTIDESARPHKWVALVDAASGDLLDSYDLVIKDSWGDLPAETGREERVVGSGENSSPQAVNQLLAEINQRNSTRQSDGASYRVLPLPLVSPLDGPFSVVTDPSDSLASPYGWHDTDGEPGAEFTDTRGNNVMVQEDRNNDNSGGDRVNGGASLEFDYHFDPELEPDEGSNDDVAGTNLFYVNNRLHDIFYRYGFTEAAGNFQQNNYDRGGVAGDPLIADFHDGRTTNNAYFTTGVDGQSPRMEMFVWEFSTPFRDSALDNSVIIHEYAHGVTTRLTGGPSSIQCLFNNEQMGEGWSDFFGLVLTMQADDQREDPRGFATYLVDQSETNRGIRLAPYSTDFNINDYTYADLQGLQSGSAQPHQVGFLYSTMLWELTWDLIDAHGFNPDVSQSWITGGNNLALQLVIDSLKIQPCQPGFVDSRDAILAADQSLTGGENKCTIWNAFARRGLGYSASQGDPDSTNDGAAAFDIPPVCQQFLKIDKQAPSDLIGVNRVLSYTLVITNDTTGPLTNLIVSDHIPDNVTYIEGSASDGGSLANGVVTFPPFDLASGQAAQRSLNVKVDQWEENHALAFVDNFEQGLMAWEATSLWRAENQAGSCGEKAAPFPSPDGAAYFGNASCEYENSRTGTLTLKTPVKLGGTKPTLRFESYEEVEPPGTFDRMYVEISIDNGSTWELLTEIKRRYDDDKTWQIESIDLSDYQDEIAQIRFRFSSDNLISNYFGWMIDNVFIGPLEQVENRACVVAREGDQACDQLETQILGGPNIALDLTIGASPSGCSDQKTLYQSERSGTAYLCYTLNNLGTVALGSHTLKDAQLGDLFINEKFVVKPGETHRFTQEVSIDMDQHFHSTWTSVQGHMVTSDGSHASVLIAAGNNTCTGFEDRALPPYLSILKGDEQSSVKITKSEPRTGDRALTLDTVCQFCNQKTIQAAVMRVDLTETSAAELELYVYPHDDQFEAEDGIYLSDGTPNRYVKVFDFEGLTPNEYNQVRLNLKGLAKQNKLDISQGNLLKIQGASRFPAFNPSENEPEARDGYTIDDLCVYPLSATVDYTLSGQTMGETCSATEYPLYTFAGEEIKLCYAVSNESLVTYHGFEISDDLFGGKVYIGSESLGPQEGFQFERSAIVDIDQQIQSTLTLASQIGSYQINASNDILILDPLEEASCAGFENGNLPRFIRPGDQTQYTLSIKEGDAYAGDHFLQLAPPCENCDGVASIELLANLKGVDNADLYWWLDNPNPAGEAGDTLLEISVDGGETYIRIGSLESNTNGYTQQKFDLDALLSSLGLNYSAEMGLRMTAKFDSGRDLPIRFDNICIDISQAVNLDRSAAAPLFAEPGSQINYPIIIKNSGLTPLTYQLDLIAAEGWEVELSPSSIRLGSGESAEISLSIEVPESAPSGEQLAATITATAQNNADIFDQIEIYPNIRRPYDLDLRAVGEAVGRPGEWVTHTVIVDNLGFTADTFDLSLVHGGDWEVSISEQSLTLEPESSETVEVAVLVPLGRLNSKRYAVDVIARSQADQTVQRRVSLLTSSAIDFVMAGLAESASGDVGGWSSYPIEISNVGTVEESVNLSVLVPNREIISLGFEIKMEESRITLKPGEKETTAVQIFTPPGLVQAVQFEIKVVAQPDSNQGDLSDLTIVNRYAPFEGHFPFYLNQ